ncbi:hypothetical protein N321_00081, partial [Antrostomus carolinensis]
LQVQDVATLKAQLAQAQQENARQAEMIAACEEEKQQLRLELRKLQESQEQSKLEARFLQEKLRELSSGALRRQQLQGQTERALTKQEEKVFFCKEELAFLKQDLHKAREQVKDLTRQQHSP